MEPSTEKISTPERSNPSLCERHGIALTVNEPIWSYGRNLTKPPFCEQCVAEERAERDAKERVRYEAEETRRKAEEFGRRQQGAGVPARYRKAMLEGVITETPAQVEVQGFGRRFVESGGKDPTGLILIGKVGAGKTFFACACVNAFLRQPRRAAEYLTALGLVRQIRSTWRSGSDYSEETVFRRFTNTSLLVLDEVGVQAGTASELALLVNLIDARYSEKRPTILIGNLTVSELTATLGERVIDRFRQGGKVLVFDWPSRREHADPDEGR
jgi:DNA replication protein DnaC